MDIESIKQEMKQKHHRGQTTVKKTRIGNGHQKKKLLSFVIRFLLCTILTGITIFLLKGNSNWKTLFYQYVFDTHFKFSTINELYQKQFGTPIPFFDELMKEPTETVFQEGFTYQNQEPFLDGVQLTLKEDQFIPSLESGIVVFIGEKEGYGNTMIIQQANGIDCWYGNVEDLSVSLYDYVEKDSLLGKASKNTLYLVFKKDGEVLDYQSYLPTSQN